MDESNLKTLFDTMPQHGTVEWIGLRPAAKEPINVVSMVEAIIGEGLKGDRFKSKYSNKREVTLIQYEHVHAVKSILDNPEISPELMRRNIVVKGINLLALKDKKFVVGNAIFEWTGLCQPCSRMEKNLGQGGYNAMRGHGGITARIIKNGEIKLGDEVYLVETSPDSSLEEPES